MICYVVINMLPYHASRVQAVVDRGEEPICVLQLWENDPLGIMPLAPEKTSFPIHTALNNPGELPKPGVLRRSLRTVLNRISPSSVCINGWGLPGTAEILEWCHENGASIVLLSESGRDDFPRHFLAERVKARIVRLTGAALVGGARHEHYLANLGMPSDRIFLGYDVVDNHHFENGAARARQNAAAERARLGLPEKFFLCVARLVPKKNLPCVLDAYARYRSQTKEPWELVIVGDGILRADLAEQALRLRCHGSVTFAGAAGYGDVPAYYGLAGCFIHASSVEQWGLVVNEAMAAGLPVLVSQRCGCVPELVRSGGNGYLFPPTGTGQLAELMTMISTTPEICSRFGETGRRIIKSWGPERFQEGLARALSAARRVGQPEPTAVDRIMLRSLSYFRRDAGNEERSVTKLPRVSPFLNS